MKSLLLLLSSLLNIASGGSVEFCRGISIIELLSLLLSLNIKSKLCSVLLCTGWLALSNLKTFDVSPNCISEVSSNKDPVIDSWLVLRRLLFIVGDGWCGGCGMRIDLVFFLLEPPPAGDKDTTFADEVGAFVGFWPFFCDVAAWAPAKWICSV